MPASSAYPLSCLRGRLPFPSPRRLPLGQLPCLASLGIATVSRTQAPSTQQWPGNRRLLSSKGEMLPGKVNVVFNCGTARESATTSAYTFLPLLNHLQQYVSVALYPRLHSLSEGKMAGRHKLGGSVEIAMRGDVGVASDGGEWILLLWRTFSLPPMDVKCLRLRGREMLGHTIVHM